VRIGELDSDFGEDALSNGLTAIRVDGRLQAIPDCLLDVKALELNGIEGIRWTERRGCHMRDVVIYDHMACAYRSSHVRSDLRLTYRSILN
jgi:hypothetical protein